ncbi:cellulose biosynthesis cyclic di-GMP-binding regulatory protein BcsB [Ramlibacter albus]|uniref:Cyclic di-GMP-binding protein n=1 Tax=Ramlibacter albus TaxID=2079448 RepID=A0A923S2B0_9BURK|nr:cellulose biosynthesis cyclic di-GMP-binding regulatory protein BcsB [Ramlibacter albus]MBC5765141.1 cellulose biosynthesis cyclic di-GMP-binding regulatory protein BcsB [Ramlibacter albus]
MKLTTSLSKSAPQLGRLIATLALAWPLLGTAQAPAPAAAQPTAQAQAQAQGSVTAPVQPGAAPAGGTLAAAAPAAAQTPGQWIPRAMSFQDLGFTGPVVLGYPDTIREIYLPVPPGINLSNATLNLDASYVRADGGRTTMIVAVDGVPVSARAFVADKGDASLVIPLDNKPRPSGFVRLNIDWRTAVARENTCADARTPGNLLRIEPTSKFTFNYAGNELLDLTTAWSALPPNPVIGISSNKLAAAAYDSAWRVGVALERAGKRPQVKAMGAGVVPDIVISDQGAGSNEVKLANMNGRPTIVVAQDAGAKAAGLFSQIWQQAAAGQSLVVTAIEEPKSENKAVTLKYLGAKPGSFDVLSHADWNATFDIGQVAADGQGPGTLVMDVAASPSAARTPPIVSVFMNEVLLGAKEMEATGRRERIVAPIPRYALASRNVIRVSFVRQLASDRCRETPEPFPVSVLASSHMLLDKIEPTGDFTGLMAAFGSGGTLVVPAAHLSDAQGTLPRVIRLASSTGLSPMKAKFVTAEGNSAPKVDGPFLAVDVPMNGDKSEVKAENGRLYLSGSKDKPLLDVRGLNRVGVLEVVNAGGNTGAVYRTLGTEPPPFDKPMQLSEGNVAIMGNNGLRTEVNTHDPGGQLAMRETKPGLFDRSYWWLLPILAVTFFIALLVYASRARRRKNASTDV